MSFVVIAVMSVRENIAALQEQIAAAPKRSGRAPSEVALMAVTKKNPPERIREAYAAGLRLFGENRVQEFDAKAAALADLADAEWHMIGHLQTNKAAKAIDLFAAVDSVDSAKLAEKLDAAARKLNRRLPVLIEVNIGGEAAKSGVAPHSPEWEALLLAAPRLEALEFYGLMTVPPPPRDAAEARRWFAELRELRDRLASATGLALSELSMGMTDDYPAAIAEGATIVRVGRAIFGERRG